MRLDRALHDREPEPGPGGLQREEWREEAGKNVRWHARAVVRDAESRRRISVLDHDREPRARGAGERVRGVVDQVLERLAERLGIAVDEDSLGELQVHVDAGLLQ